MNIFRMRFLAAAVFFATFAPIFLLAQSGNLGTIKGTVHDDSTALPLEFVNVVVYRAADSALTTGQMTDEDGKFTLNISSAGEYFVKFSMIGYKEKATRQFVIDSLHQHLNLGTIRLVLSAVKLNEVVITGEKSMFNNSIDRKVYNVEQDLMSKTGSASDLLQKVPSVQVDIDGNVSLRGSSSVLIMLNGKTSALMDKSSAVVLQQMPASSIERIEVITNPSAKYNPEGTAGIINIVMKKNTGLGFNGDLTANVGTGGRYNGNVKLNYNPGTFNLHTSYALRQDNRNRTSSDTRSQIDDANAISYYRGDLFSYASPFSNIAELGIDYRPDRQNQIGVSGNYFVNTFTRNDDLNVLVQDSSGATDAVYTRSRYDPEYEKEYEVTAFAEHAFPQEGHTLRSEFTHSQSPEGEDNHFTTVYLTPAYPNSYDNTNIYHNEIRNQLSLDYSNPLTESSKFEAGYAGQFSRSDHDFYVEYFDNSLQQFVKDSLKSNEFRFNETIHAVYATYEHAIGSFGFQAGLRGEHADVESELITRDSMVQNSYVSLFPSLHLSYQLNEGAELQLSYSRRTNRPDADDLNPFPEFRDPRNISAGNPYLLPEYIHSLELGCQFETGDISILPALYYRYIYNKFTSVTQSLNDSTLLTTRHNLSNDQSGGLEIVLSADLGSFFSAHWNANGFYERIDASNLGFEENKSSVTWSSNLTLNLNFTETSKMQVNSIYTSRRLTPQGEYLPSYQVNLGFRQGLFDGKLAIVATVSDIFRTQKRQLELETPALDQTVINTRDSRIAYIGFTYHFGILPKNSGEEQMRYESGD